MARKTLVVFVDAFGPLQLERFGRRLGFLQHHRSVGGVLGYTSGALPTVLTGQPPAVHGRMCLFTAHRAGERHILSPLRWLGLLPRPLHERHSVRRLAERWLSWRNDLSGYVALHKVPPEHFGWLSLPERDDLFQSPTIGGATTFLAEAREAGLSVYASPWQIAEPQRWIDTHDALERQKPDLAFLYAAELDAVLHAEGNAGRGADAAVDRIARNIDRARLQMSSGGDDVSTFVIGDHGMADVVATVDPRALLPNLGDSTRAFVDSTMLRLWGEVGALERARTLLDETRWPGTWMDAGALERAAAPTGDAYGDAIFVLDEGVMFAPSFLGGAARGMHGYSVHAASARAALASDHPLPSECQSLTGLAPLVRSTLGLGAS